MTAHPISGTAAKCGKFYGVGVLGEVSFMKLMHHFW